MNNSIQPNRPTPLGVPDRAPAPRSADSELPRDVFEGASGLAALAELAVRSAGRGAQGLAASAAPLKLIITAPDAGERERLKKLFLEQDPGNRITVDLPLVQGFAVEVSPTAVQVLPELGKMSRDVRAILDNEMGIPEGAHPLEGARRPVAGLDTATATLGLGHLWERGVKGRDVTIAVVDTGIAPHPDLTNRIIGFKDIINGRDQAYDDQGHGTHVAGIAAGDGTSSDGTYTGAAPEANLVGVKVLDSGGSGSFSTVIAGIQWVIENKDRFGIEVMNLSLGGRASQGYKDDPVAQAIEAAAAAGIVPCVAAGNSGPIGRTINSPAHAPQAFTIGAFDDAGTPVRGDDIIADFSSRGPTPFDGLPKPDVLGPGVEITAASNRDSGYRTLSGTSMAAPMVAGVAALIRQARPDLSPAQVKDVLMQSAQPLPNLKDPNWQGKGAIDAAAAYDAAVALPLPEPPPESPPEPPPPPTVS